MSIPSLQFSALRSTLIDYVTTGKFINQIEYDEVTDDLNMQEAIKLDKIFIDLLHKKFGKKKASEAIEYNTIDLCLAYSSLESH